MSVRNVHDVLRCGLTGNSKLPVGLIVSVNY